MGVLRPRLPVINEQQPNLNFAAKLPATVNPDTCGSDAKFDFFLDAEYFCVRKEKFQKFKNIRIPVDGA